MTRNIVFLIALTTLTAGISLNAEPTPTAARTSSRNAKTVQKPQAKTETASRTVPAPPLAEGWNYVNGEWIHSEGYKYVRGRVIRTGAQTLKRPPKPPSKALLNSVKPSPTPSPDPDSAAAKAERKARNMRPRPAPQTGTHL